MRDKLKTNIVGVFIFFIFVSIFLLQMTSAVLMSDQGTDVKNKSSGQLLSIGNLSINIYDNETGGTLIYQSNTSNGIANGSWNLMISPTLEFGKYYWKDYAINGEDLDFDGNERIKFQSPLGLINNVSFINFSLISSCQAGYSIRLIYANGSVECEADDTGNGTSSDLINYALKNQSENFAGDVNVSGNVTTTKYGFFGWLGSLASRITKLFVQDIDVSGNVNVSGNVTASYFIGNGSLLTGITSSSTYNATYHNYVIANISNNTNCWQGNCNISYFYPYSNPLGFVTSAGTDSWAGNYTLYYNKTQIDNNLSLYVSSSSLYSNLSNYLLANGSRVLTGNLNLGGFNITNVGNITSNYVCNSSNCYTLAQFLIDTTGGTDSWSTNYTDYYNKTRINENFSLYYTKVQTDNNFTLYLPLTGGSLTGNLNLGGFNISNIGNITSNYVCNSTNCYTLVQFLTDTGGTDSWAGNYTNYYNKTIIDNNFSLYYLKTSVDNNFSLYYPKTAIDNNFTLYLPLTGGVLSGNLTLTALNITSNYVCNSSNCYTLAQFLIDTSSGTDSWAGNYTSYYNKTQIDNNFTLYYPKTQVDNNFTKYLLLAGGTLTGDLNLGGFNISNVGNITSNYVCNSSTCYLLSDLLATSGSTYNVTYHNYVTANISNQSYNWITSNNLTMNGINTTQMRNVGGILTVLRDWWDTLYCKLTGCTMTGDLNMNGNNITNVKNISSDYYCNATNCYTLVQFLTDTTGGTDSWSLNYTFYYNKTQVDNNFSSYLPITSLYANLTNYMLKNGSTIGTGNFNFGNYNISGITNITATNIISSGFTINNNINGTGNISVQTNNKFCLDGTACTKYIYYNGSSVIIQG